jgi:hypothetical protein
MILRFAPAAGKNCNRPRLNYRFGFFKYVPSVKERQPSRLSLFLFFKKTICVYDFAIVY